MLLVITYENYQLRKRPLSLSLRPPSSTSALRLTTTELNFSSRAEVVTHEPSAVSQYLSRVTPVTTSLVKARVHCPLVAFANTAENEPFEVPKRVGGRGGALK